MKNWKIKLTGVLCFLVFAASACSGDSPDMVNAGIESLKPTTVTPLPTETATTVPTATFTATPEPTLTATPEPTATQTPMPSPTPFTGFEQSRINTHQFSGDWYMFIFGVPGVQQDYYAMIHNTYYECSVNESYPDVLICVGDYFELYDDVVYVSFYEDAAMTKSVYAQSYYSGPTATLPEIKGDPDTWCPERGENVTCETEYRSYQGEECIVQSCFDACGYYYSVHTCPNDVPLSEFIFLPPPDER